MSEPVRSLHICVFTIPNGQQHHYNGHETVGFGSPKRALRDRTLLLTIKIRSAAGIYRKFIILQAFGKKIVLEVP